VLEIVLGIVIGPHVLGWVSIGTPIQVISLLGVAFLLGYQEAVQTLRALAEPPHATTAGSKSWTKR
jgi:hypothetical protein